MLAILPAHRSLNLGAIEGTEVGKYLHPVHYFGAASDGFIDQLRKTGALEMTTVAVYGNHKGYIGDEAALFRLVNIEARQKRETWLLNKRVQFLICLPRGDHTGDIAVPGGHLDIASTILALLGLEGQDRLMLGWDLTGRPAGPVIFRDGSFIDREYKIMVRGPRPLCFDQAGLPLNCSVLNGTRNEAVDQLQTPDFIIQGNLIPTLSANSPNDLGKPGR